jgi:hypothetical protein
VISTKQEDVCREKDFQHIQKDHGFVRGETSINVFSKENVKAAVRTAEVGENADEGTNETGKISNNDEILRKCQDSRIGGNIEARFSEARMMRRMVESLRKLRCNS